VVKALRLACWNTDYVRCRKLELEHLLRQHGVDICLLTETRLRERASFDMQTMFVTEQTSTKREAGQQYWSVGV
jgi:exonuclease III